jgi:hypothetical protein
MNGIDIADEMILLRNREKSMNAHLLQDIVRNTGECICETVISREIRLSDSDGHKQPTGRHEK